MTSLSVTKRAIQGIQIKWEVLKNFYSFFFFPANFMSSFHKYHLGNYDSWLSLEERNLKPFIWVSTSQSVPREMQKDTVLKLTKKFFTISPFLKNMVLFVNRWPHTVDTATEGSSTWGTRLSSHVIKCYWYYDIKELKCSYKDLHYKTLWTVF